MLSTLTCHVLHSLQLQLLVLFDHHSLECHEVVTHQQLFEEPPLLGLQSFADHIFDSFLCDAHLLHHTVDESHNQVSKLLEDLGVGEGVLFLVLKDDAIGLEEVEDRGPPKRRVEILGDVLEGPAVVYLLRCLLLLLFLIFLFLFGPE